jgi:hypothetical protein
MTIIPMYSIEQNAIDALKDAIGHICATQCTEATLELRMSLKSALVAMQEKYGITPTIPCRAVSYEGAGA